MAHIIGRNEDGTIAVFSTVVMGLVHDAMPEAEAVATYGQERVEAAPAVGSDEWRFYTEPVARIHIAADGSVIIKPCPPDIG